MSPTTRPAASAVLRAALAAGAVSGAPSTAHAVWRGRPVLDSTRAAGTLLGARSVVRGAIAHTVLATGWTAVLAAFLPRRRRVAWGAGAGLLIGLVDLAIARRRYPAIAALARRPQLVDHVVFGAVVGLVAAPPGAPPRPASTSGVVK